MRNGNVMNLGVPWLLGLVSAQSSWLPEMTEQIQHDGDCLDALLFHMDFYSATSAQLAIEPGQGKTWEPTDKVEEKFEKYFRYLARCEDFFALQPYFFLKKNRIKIKQNAGKMTSKFENRALKTISPNLKSVTQNP